MHAGQKSTAAVTLQRERIASVYQRPRLLNGVIRRGAFLTSEYAAPNLPVMKSTICRNCGIGVKLLMDGTTLDASG
jgi:hypothetical protein